MSYIKHQTQPCNTSCMSTCLAMIVNKPAQEIIDKYHARYRGESISLRQMLNDLQVPFKSFDSADHTLLSEVGAYMVSVPSVNIKGGLHQIVIEVRDFDYLVHDPVRGKPGRYYYVNRGEAKGEFEVGLGGFVVDAFISWTYLRDRE